MPHSPNCNNKTKCMSAYPFMQEVVYDLSTLGQPSVYQTKPT